MAIGKWLWNLYEAAIGRIQRPSIRLNVGTLQIEKTQISIKSPTELLVEKSLNSNRYLHQRLDFEARIFMLEIQHSGFSTNRWLKLEDIKLDSTRHSPLLIAVDTNSVKDVTELLTQATCQSEKDFALHYAIFKANKEIAIKLVDAGANLEKESQKILDRTRLCWTQCRNDWRKLVVLLKRRQEQLPELRKQHDTLLLGLHKRCGAESPLQMLPQYVMQDIARITKADL